MMLFGDLLYSDASSLGCGDVIWEDGEMAKVLRDPASEALALPGPARPPAPPGSALKPSDDFCVSEQWCITGFCSLEQLFFACKNCSYSCIFFREV